MAVIDDEMAPLPDTRPGVRAWIVRALVAGALVAGSIAGVRAYQRAHVPPAPASTTVRRGHVAQTTQATGRIVPRQEIVVRPLVAGILAELRVRPGDRVHRGDHLATVRIVADPVALSDARAQVRTAEVKLDRARRELARAHDLARRSLDTPQALAAAEDDAAIAHSDLAAARLRVTLTAQGSGVAGAARSTRVFATVDGTVLAVPVNVGDFVIDANSFRDGTAIAVLADMSDVLFKGEIEEAYVGQLRLGMPVTIRIGALPGQTLRGTLQWISPRATVEQNGVSAAPGTVGALTASTAGITRFELWAAVDHAPDTVRAGYSASAEIELARRDGVVLVAESALRFERERAFAKGCAPGASEHAVTVGVSDGVDVEVLDGLREGQCVLERVP